MSEISPVTFKSACVISDNLVYLSASLDNLDDDAEYSRCILFDYNEGLQNGWYYHDLEFDVVSVCYNNNENNRKIFSMSNEGHLEEFDGINGKLSFIEGSGLNESWSLGKGYLFTIKSINNDIFSTGYESQIFRYIDNKWISFNNGLITGLHSEIDFSNIESTKEEQDISVIDICGRYSGEFFCVGRIGESGLIAHYDGNQWNFLDRKTPATLYSLLLLKSGEILTSGTQGNLFLIKEDTSIQRLTDLKFSSDFYSLAEFNGDVYIGSSEGIYIYSNQKLNKININSQIDENLIFKLEASQSYLWAFTNKFILRFDGVEWVIIKHPDNQEEHQSIFSVKAGENCPQSGYWYTTAKKNSRRFFNQGDIFPDFESDWGDVYWQFDCED